MKLEKILAVAACAVLALCLLAGCSNNANEQKDEGENNAGMANPWVECDDLAAAQETAGFDLVLPLDETPGFEYRAIAGEMIEVVSPNGGSVVMRKGVGTEDASGDYTEYKFVGEAVDGDLTVTVKGMTEDEILLGTWTVGEGDGAYSYSIAFGDPVTQDNMVEMAKVMK